MRKNIIYFLLAMMAFACGGSNTSESENDSTAVAGEEIKPVAAVCVWDNLSVRSIPSDKGKWLTSLSLGESITLLNETEVDSTSERTYTKVQLTDGNEGWSLADFIVADGEAATFIQDADVYSRPDLLTKTNKQYSRMDIVAIKSTQDDWLEVVGKRNDGRYIETNWVKSDNISTEDVDIAVAKFAAPIAKMDDLEKKEEALKNLISNSDLNNSVFMADLMTQYDELQYAVETVNEDDLLEEEIEELGAEEI
jgi:uncharacterized protein YgiM (DUF1202 family)